MAEQPKRRYELTLTMGADDLPYLRNMLSNLLMELDGIPEDETWRITSGGYGGSFNLDMIVSPDITHDTYFVEMATYLANKKQPHPPTNPVTVSLDAKERLISERGLTEADFIMDIEHPDD